MLPSSATSQAAEEIGRLSLAEQLESGTMSSPGMGTASLEQGVIHGDAGNSLGNLRRLTDSIDITFSDPPYPVSSEMFEYVTENKDLAEFSGNKLVWEIPSHSENDTTFLKPLLWKLSKVRKFGRTEFRFYKAKIPS